MFVLVLCTSPNYLYCFKKQSVLLEFSDSFSSASETDSSCSSGASTIILSEVPNKRQRTEEANALTAKQVRTKLFFLS